LLPHAVIPDTSRRGSFALKGYIEDGMLTQLFSGNIPLSGPKHLMLSPLAMVVHCSLLNRFPTQRNERQAPDALQACMDERKEPALSDSSLEPPVLPSLRAIKHRTTASRKVLLPEAPSPGEQPTIPAFALEFEEENALVPATSKLVLFLPGDDTRPMPVRVVERSACKAKWYSVESWHANVRRWVDRGSSAKEESAFDTARNMSWLFTAQDE
jgi:hypothetical protein